MLKNQELLNKCLGIIDTCLEITEFFLINGNISKYKDLILSVDEGLKALHSQTTEFEIEMPNIKFVTTVENIQYSALKSIKRNSIEIMEFETIPLLEELRYMLYYWGKIYPNKSKIEEFMNEEVYEFCGNKYFREYEEIGEFKHELAISVLAYNNLEYTKLCVESILETVPKDISCEIILMNHGSTDNTQSYFEELKTGKIEKKIFQLYRNNGNFVASRRIIESKYHITFSNDVVALPNAIENMLKLAQSDDSAAYIVPTTPAVSNLQTIEASYTSLEEAFIFGKQNNQYNPYRHEQRVRLCNPVTMTPSKYAFSKKDGIFAGVYSYTSEFVSFGDDKISLLYRRNKLKCILQKDAYCHHFGSVTIKNEIEKEKEVEFYLKGRKLFKNEFGIDPWGIGFCYDYKLFEYLNCDDVEEINVLGINCGIGSNPLKIREQIKENTHNLDVKIYNLTDDKAYKDDLKGVSDIVDDIFSTEDIQNAYKSILFKYILFESGTEGYKMDEIVPILMSKLDDNGKLCIMNADIECDKKIESSLYPGSYWFIKEKSASIKSR